MDEIRIVDLEVFANHGVFPEENALGQKFIVNLVLRGDFSAACKSDALDDSVDYGAVCHLVDATLRASTLSARRRLRPMPCWVDFRWFKKLMLS